MKQQQMKKIQQTEIQIMCTGQTFERPSKECRICMEEQSSQEKLITPCKCSGTMTYIHEKCLQEWILKKHCSKEGFIECELCKQKITFQYQFKTKCKNCQQFKEQVEEQPKLFYFLVIVTIINLGFLIFLIILVSDTDIETVSNAQVIKISIITTAIVALGAVITVSLYIMLREFFLSRVQQITKIYEIQKVQPQKTEQKMKQSKNSSSFNSKTTNKIANTVELYQFDIQ